MTISTQDSKVNYQGNGQTTVFQIPFPFLENNQIYVQKKDAQGNLINYTYGTDYTVTGAGEENGGSVTLNVAPEQGSTISIYRDVPLTQEVDYRENEIFPAETHEEALDKLTMEVQQIQEQLDRSVKVDRFSDVDLDIFVNEEIERVYDSTDNIDIVANNINNVNTVGGNIANVNTVAGDIDSVVTTATNVEDVKTVAQNKASLNVTAANIADVKTVAKDIASVNTTSTNIEDVKTNATNITDINTNAANIGSINQVADIRNNVTLVALNNRKVTTVADNIDNVNVVANNITNVVSTGASIDNVNTVAGDIANVNTVAGIKDNVDKVAMINTQVKKVGDNINDVMTVANIDTQVSTVADNAVAVKQIGDNIDVVLKSPTYANNAKTWSEGTDTEVGSLGGTHSAKGWAEIAAQVAQVNPADETTAGIIRIATMDEAMAGAVDTAAITPLKAKTVVNDYVGKVVQLKFNGTLTGDTLTFEPDQEPYTVKAGYEYEVDLLYPVAGVLPDATKIVIKNGEETITLLNVKDADASTPMTYGAMKQMCRYDAEIGWRWVFNARYAVTDTGVKVLVMPSAVIADDRYVTTDTAQTISASKKMSISGTFAYSRPIEIMMPTSTESNPTENKTREIAFLASEGAGEWYEGSLTHSRYTDGASYTGLRAGHLVNGTYKEGAIGVRTLADGTSFATAPSTPDNPPNMAIATADYVQNKFVTKDTAQTISGYKRFTKPVEGMSIELTADTNQQTVPTTTTVRELGLYRNSTYTKGDGYTSWLQGYRGSDGFTATEIYTRRFLEGDSQEIVNYLRVNITPDGTPISYTKTPPANVSGEEIVTAAWFNSKMQVVSALPANPDPNVFYFIPG